MQAAAPSVPDQEDSEILAAAGLSPIGGDADIIRYTLRRGFYGRSEPKAQVAQVSWVYNAEEPQALLVELAHRDGAWRVIGRSQAPMTRQAFKQLANNVAAVVSVIGNREGPRGSVLACSHANSSRLDLSIIDDRELRMSRGAHCDDGAPAVVAGELVSDAIRKAIKVDALPADTQE